MKNLLFLLCFLLLAAIGSAGYCANILRNSGFEDPEGWSKSWSIHDSKGGDVTYHYHLTNKGGGHGDAKPRTGENAVEIYTSDRTTFLSQSVNLEPGTYRLSAWVRANGQPSHIQMQLKLGDQVKEIPVSSQKYRLIWSDFQIDKAGDYVVSLHSPSLGIAIDDVSLEKITGSTDKGPALYIDLMPSNAAHAGNVQYCLANSLQWVDVFTTCIDSSQLKYPVMHILVSDPVKLSGINEKVLESYKMREEDTIKIRQDKVHRNGIRYTRFSFPLLRFVSGYNTPQGFGGLWLSNVKGDNGKMIVEVVDGGSMLASETYKLVSVSQPKIAKSPKKYYIIPYAVQNWKMNLEQTLKALPAQFKMMGMNVWSDYGLSAEKTPETVTDEEKVRQEAYRKYGVRLFWPNSSSLMETTAGAMYSDVAEQVNDPDMYVVGPDGKINKSLYNFNYAANSGKAWMESALASWLRTIKRPERVGLSYRHTGLINDALEGIYFSYDPTTLKAFADHKGVDVGLVTPEKLNSDWRHDWQLFNMDLYSRIVEIWSREARKIDPDLVIINTASTYGPSGLDTLSPKENYQWAKYVDYNMPQWYSGGYLGDAYVNFIVNDTEGLFDKSRGGTELIPLLNLSMGAELEDPLVLRFMLLSYISSSKNVKGISYFIGTNAFADAAFMVGLSRAHTLIADIEDYYADGVREDSMVKIAEVLDKDNAVQAIDDLGDQSFIKPVINNTLRVHKLSGKGKVALITALSYSNQAVGSRFTVDIDTTKLPSNKKLYIKDHLSGKVTPFTSQITIDTTETKSAAVLEITENSK